MAMFNSYVKLPEGRLLQKSRQIWKMGRCMVIWCFFFKKGSRICWYCLIWLVHFLIGTKKERIDPEISGCICIQADHVVYSFKTRHSKHDFDSQIGTTRFKSGWLYFAPIQTNCALNCGIYLPKWSIHPTMTGDSATGCCIKMVQLENFSAAFDLKLPA